MQNHPFGIILWSSHLFIEMYITPTKAKVAVVEKAMRQKGVRGNPDVTPILQDDWKLLKSYVSKGGYSPAGLPSTYKSVFKSAKKEGDVCRGES